MAFNGILEIDNKQYRMLQWSLHVNQSIDRNGRPMANPAGGLLNITLESTGENDFFEWVVSPEMMKSGSIKFQRRDNTSSLKSFEFRNAYCTDYFEDFVSGGTSPMKLRITISAMEIQSGSTTMAKNREKATAAG